MLFKGRIRRNLDNKSRVMLPQNFREILAVRSPDGSMVFTTYDGCLVCYPLPEWEEFEKSVSALRGARDKIRNFRRLTLGGAEDIKPDSQGRVRLSKEHLLYSGISEEVVIVGQGSRFELWEPERLKQVLNSDFSDLGEGQDFDLPI